MSSSSFAEPILTGLKQKLFSHKASRSFADYMQYVLYEPGLGYYANGSQKFGAAGDFVTAPELSPLFAKCLAQQCMQILPLLLDGCILEFGAGSGVLAAQLLLALEEQNALPYHYYILEISSELQLRQKETITRCCPHLLPKIIWLNQLPTTPIEAVIIANEVLDAMPVHLFQIKQGEFYERGVTLQQDQLTWTLLPNEALKIQVLPLLAHHPQDYQSEINLWIKPWLSSLQQCLKRGIALIIDYGFTRAEYYHPQRNQGTLMCHYQHRAHGDPLIYPGLQDITAHVDFTHIANAAHQQGWHVAGFCNQAHFLLSCGLINFAVSSDLRTQFDYNQQIKILTLPHEMGELFKVMALTKEIDVPLLGFALQDWRIKL